MTGGALGMPKAPLPWTPPERFVAAQTTELMASIDPKAYVGHKHHIVPRFILKRFANAREQVLRRDRRTNVTRICNIRDLAVTDFYTFINKSGELDASLEKLWGTVERGAANVIHAHLDNPFARPRALDRDEKLLLDAFVALQLVRGPSSRRAAELIADYSLKLVNRDKLTPDELARLEFVPHQNEHIQMLSSLVDKVAGHLATRPTMLVTIDRPLLLISDEPVCLERPGDYTRPTRKQLRDYPRSVLIDGEPIDPRDVIQIQGNTAGLFEAEGIAMPIGSRHAIFYDKPGRTHPIPPIRIEGRKADDFAQEVNDLCIDQAVQWVVAHPENPNLRGRRFPKPTPQVTIYDGGSQLAHRARTTDRRQAHRLDKTVAPLPNE